MLKTLPVVTGFALAIAFLGPGAARAQAVAPQSGLDATWGEGSRLVHQGVTGLVAADKALSDSTRRGMDAMARKTTSGANAQRASDEFRRLSSSTPTSTDAAEAQRWASLVQAAATRWQGFQSQETEATRDLNAAIQQTSSAQKAIEAAMAQVDRGRGMIVEPQQTPIDPQQASPTSAASRKPLY